jgi:heat shock protein HslJ
MPTESLRRGALAALSAAVLAGCAAAPSAPGDAGALPPLRAQGAAPDWALSIDASLRFSARDLQVSGPATPVRVDGDRRVYAAALRDRAIAVGVEVVATPGLCRDGRSAMPYPLQVSVAVDGRHFSGCGGEPAALLSGGEWRVEEIAGEPAAGVPGEAAPTLRFAADGRVSGRAGCNRFTAGYTLDGERLRIERAASTRMACPPPRMALEQRFLDFLGDVRRFDIDAEGRLLLIDGEGRRLRAHR